MANSEGRKTFKIIHQLAIDRTKSGSQPIKDYCKQKKLLFLFFMLRFEMDTKIKRKTPNFLFSISEDVESLVEGCAGLSGSHVDYFCKAV
ncbi:hypothetical protein AMJ44_07865 [candidate division WOR-1 bacterium DG_54_3]|uniref:Uncharacterized protein n=1 Tax=candidate division WOR-1 bacterium DG_54_3 TaxID=1703775 RepID=A0A0S7XXB8_UNCSA|nr:MAG: hypothetical protein AMJ44_07865 [candidate division WOR-1 bacterium DG_54_3]